MAFDFNNLDDIQDDLMSDTKSYMMASSTCISSVLYKHFDIQFNGFKDEKDIDPYFNCKPYIKRNISNVTSIHIKKFEKILLTNKWRSLSLDTISYLQHKYHNVKIHSSKENVYKHEINFLKNTIPDFFKNLEKFCKNSNFVSAILDKIIISPDNGIAYILFRPSYYRQPQGFAMFVLTDKQFYDDCFTKTKKTTDNFEKLMRKVCRHYEVKIPTGIFKHVQIGGKDALQYSIPIHESTKTPGKWIHDSVDPGRYVYNQICNHWQQLFTDGENDNEIPEFIIKHANGIVTRAYANSRLLLKSKDKNIIFYNDVDYDKKLVYKTIICMDNSKYNDKTGELIK